MGEVAIARVDVAALLALIAALISGVGDVIRQRSAQEITDQQVGHVELLRMSLRDARWWLGGGALFAVLTKAIVDVLPDGLVALLRTPELYGWVLVAALGTIFQQSSFQASALTASLPTMTVAEPLVASVLGVTVLGETLDAGVPEIIVLVAAVLVVVVATAALARGEAASMNATDGVASPAPDGASLLPSTVVSEA